jgi:polyferredoxin
LLNEVKLRIISGKTEKRVVVGKLHQLLPLSLCVHWGIKYKDRVDVFKKREEKLLYL